MENKNAEEMRKAILGSSEFAGMSLQQFLNLPAPVAEKAICNGEVPPLLLHEYLQWELARRERIKAYDEQSKQS